MIEKHPLFAQDALTHIDLGHFAVTDLNYWDHIHGWRLPKVGTLHFTIVHQTVEAAKAIRAWLNVVPVSLHLRKIAPSMANRRGSVRWDPCLSGFPALDPPFQIFSCDFSHVQDGLSRTVSVQSCGQFEQILPIIINHRFTSCGLDPVLRKMISHACRRCQNIVKSCGRWSRFQLMPGDEDDPTIHGFIEMLISRWSRIFCCQERPFGIFLKLPHLLRSMHPDLPEKTFWWIFRKPVGFPSDCPRTHWNYFGCFPAAYWIVFCWRKCRLAHGRGRGKFFNPILLLGEFFGRSDFGKSNQVSGLQSSSMGITMVGRCRGYFRHWPWNWWCSHKRPHFRLHSLVCDGLREHGTCLDHASHDALGNADVPDRRSLDLPRFHRPRSGRLRHCIGRDIPADFDYPVETHMPGAGIVLSPYRPIGIPVGITRHWLRWYGFVLRETGICPGRFEFRLQSPITFVMVNPSSPAVENHLDQFSPPWLLEWFLRLNWLPGAGLSEEEISA